MYPSYMVKVVKRTNVEIVRIILFYIYGTIGSYQTTRDLAKNGLYYENGEIKCFSCQFKTKEISNPRNVIVQHGICELRNNHPLPPNEKDYTFEANRLLTFLQVGWPIKANTEYKVGALDLASNGFVYLGPSDAVSCAFCRLEISGFEPGDTARKEHKKWSQHCVFLTNQRLSNNVPMHATFDEIKQIVQSVVPDSAKFRDAVVVKTTDLSGNDAAIIRMTMSQANTSKSNAPSYNTSDSPRYPKYEDRADRMESFGSWPIGLKTRPKELCDAGFYYTGMSDRVICFHCGGGLKDFSSEDVPLDEHLKYFTECKYVQTLGGSKSSLKNVQHLTSQL